MTVALARVEPLENRRLLSVAVAGSVAGSTSTVQTINVQPDPTPVGVTVHTEATDSFSGTVGILKNFVPPPLTQPPTPALIGLQTIINWGDGTAPTAGTYSFDSSNQFIVHGTHTWAKAGTYNITVSVIWGPLPGSNAMVPSVLLHTIMSKAVVTPDDDGGVTLHETAGTAFKATLGYFDFRSVDLITRATIDWGDGMRSTGTIIGDFATGEYHVVGSHTYRSAGKYKVHIKILSHVAGAPSSVPSSTVTQWTSTINVQART